MIQLPRRSVTRFFIPLIDVLTLLFCIFLLMPLIKATGETQNATGQESAFADSQSQKRLSVEQPITPDQERLQQERKELERIRRERIEVLQQRLYIRVVEIDADTGKLFYQDANQRLEIHNQEEAVRLIRNHREEAGTRELYYLFLYPRRLTGFPQRGQVERYEGWFKEVAHSVDNPRGSP
jgi:hypothetical protein